MYSFISGLVEWRHLQATCFFTAAMRKEVPQAPESTNCPGIPSPINSNGALLAFFREIATCILSIQLSHVAIDIPFTTFPGNPTKQITTLCCALTKTKSCRYAAGCDASEAPRAKKSSKNSDAASESEERSTGDPWKAMSVKICYRRVPPKFGSNFCTDSLCSRSSGT